jgi:AraC family transcriptional regulator
MDARLGLVLVTGATDAGGRAQGRVPRRPPTVRIVANAVGTEDLIAVEVGSLLEDIQTALACDLSAATQAARSLAALLASSLPHDARAARARGGLAPWQKHKIQSYIEKNLEDPLLIEDLARMVSLSSSYFCRAFRESLGESPRAYIIRVRIERARSLMLTTSDSLSEIALACGLVDQSHLCRCFRQVTGTTPGAWRRRHASQYKSPSLAVNDHERA